MKNSLIQTKLLFLVFLLIPVVSVTSENIEEIKIPSMGKRDPLAVYEIWDQDGKLHPEGPFTIEEFSSIVDEKIWFGYKKESDSIKLLAGKTVRSDVRQKFLLLFRLKMEIYQLDPQMKTSVVGFISRTIYKSLLAKIVLQ